MRKQQLTTMMVEVLQEIVDENSLEREGDGGGVQVTADSPLIGAEAVVTSINLVSFIVDVESRLSEDYGLSVTLVSEQALSRKKSPFRTIDTLVEYVVELEPSLMDVESSQEQVELSA